MILDFGVPSQRTAKKEKYSDRAVITMLEHKGKGTAKKLEFNKKAEELLKLDEGSSVAISFANGKVIMVKSNGQENEFYGVTKNSPKSFSNSRVYDYFQKFLNLETSVDNEFELVAGESLYSGAPICELVLIGVKKNEVSLPVEPQVTESVLQEVLLEEVSFEEVK